MPTARDVKIADVKAVVEKYLEVQNPDRTRCAEAKRLLLGYAIANPTYNLYKFFLTCEIPYADASSDQG